MALLGLYNKIDTSTLSGGTWSSNLPRANIKSRLLSEVARTTTADAFTLIIDLAATGNVGVVAIANHNFSSAATVRVETYIDSTLKDDSGLIRPHAGFFCYALAANETANKVKITIDDTTNTAGYLQFGLVFVGDAFEPAINVEYAGVSHSLVTHSKVDKVPNGIKFFKRRTTARVVTADFSHCTLAEIATLRTAQRDHDIVDEVVFVDRRAVYTDDAGVWVQDDYSFEFSFMGTFTELSAIKFPYFNAASGSVAIEEVI